MIQTNMKASGGMAPGHGFAGHDPASLSPETRPSFGQRGNLRKSREKMLKAKAAFLKKQRAKKARK